MNNHLLFCAVLASIFTSSVSEDVFPAQKTMYVKDILTLSKAASMRSYMNIAASPCDDFYEFACGNWIRVNPATGSKGRTQTTVLNELTRAYERKLIKLLSAQIEMAENDVDRKMMLFFQSCERGEQNKTALMKLMGEYGKMPALVGVAWKEGNFDWLETLSSLKRKYGLQILIGLDVGADLKHGEINRIYIGQPALKFLSKSLYLEPSGLKYRLAYRAEVAKHLEEYFDIQAESALQIAEELVGFEILLANGLLPDKTDLSNDNLINETTIDELQRKYSPTIDFKRFFNNTIGEIPHGPIYVFVESYLKNLRYVLETTNPRLIANYIYYHFLKEFVFQAENNPQERKALCLHKVRQHFSESLENMAYRRYNIAATEEDLKTIWIALRKAFKAKLFGNILDWMTPKVREYAELKLNEVSLQINSYETRNFSQHFEQVVVKRGDFIGNMKQVLEFSTNHVFGKINKPVKPEDNIEYFSIVPFSAYTENRVKIPVLLLQPYFIWAANYPSALKFGTLGFLIARQLIHFFDDKGRLYDKAGDMRNWWDEPTTNAFMIERECFMQQYPQIYFNNPSSFQTVDLQSENIADSGALKLAYNAFVQWKGSAIFESREGEDFEKLPHMNYTDEELFFLSFAQLWCNDAHPSMENFHANLDHHTPGQFRVNGALSNAEEFSEAYKCDVKSAMRPEVYCEIF